MIKLTEKNQGGNKTLIRLFIKSTSGTLSEVVLIPGGLFLVDFINGLSLIKDFYKDEFIYHNEGTTIRQHDRWSLIRDGELSI